MRLLDRLRGDGGPCGCDPAFEEDRLVVDADGCAGRGHLESAPDCRATVVGALADRDADAVITRADGLERAYEGRAGALLVAAGRFVERATVHDGDLAARARRDPLAAARAATARAGVVADVAAETGLAECARGVESAEAALRPYVAPTLTRSRVAPRPPPDARLRDRRELETDAVARTYARPAADLRTYHLEPVELSLDAAATRLLARAHERLASGAVGGGERAPGRAVRAVVDGTHDGDGALDGTGEAVPVETLAAVLRKHTRGNGVLEDLFADPAVSDVYATAPVAHNPLRVVADGETMRTNVRLTPDGAAALASRFRRESGRAFSRASPALDANVEAAGRAVRVAGLTEPSSDGVAFAFRARDRRAWTLPALVDNGTVPPRAAALLSLAVARGASLLVAGGRGAGKTTLLGALLWELAPATRAVVIEDTRELPVGALQGHGRDVQAVRTTAGEEAGLDAVAALRTALRLGEGALVVGEVRGEEAAVLYEAMRVGAGSGAVLGTIHGDGVGAVRERVVEDLGVPASSFAATDLVATVERRPGGRRLAAVDEVLDGDTFAPLFAVDADAPGASAGGANADGASAGGSSTGAASHDGASADGDGPGASGAAAGGPAPEKSAPNGRVTATPTGRIDRGESVVLDGLARPGESYADVREALLDRAGALRRMADGDLTRPADVADGYAPPRPGAGGAGTDA